MARPPTKDDTLRFVERLRVDLDHKHAAGQPPVAKRLLRRVVEQCRRQKATVHFLDELDRFLQQHEIYTRTPVTDKALRLGDWIYFSLHAIPPEDALFPTEADLGKFVESSLRTGSFGNLRVAKVDRKSGRQFMLPTGKRIDLLCEEYSKRGIESYVAMEIKKSSDPGTVTQLLGYMNELRSIVDKPVRGLIITGRGDPIGRQLARGHSIDWYHYSVKFSLQTADGP